jgi:anti-anti-sigma factor
MPGSDAIDVVEIEGVTTVTVRGDFDALVADGFVSAALKGAGPVQVDLIHVTFLDSAGLSAMAQVVAALDGEDRALTVVDASAIARRVIGICAMDELLGLGPPAG